MSGRTVQKFAPPCRESSAQSPKARDPCQGRFHPPECHPLQGRPCSLPFRLKTLAPPLAMPGKLISLRILPFSLSYMATSPCLPPGQSQGKTGQAPLKRAPPIGAVTKRDFRNIEIQRRSLRFISQ